MVCKKCGKTLPDDAAFCAWCGRRQVPQPRKALKRANGMGTVYKLQGRRRRPWVAAKRKIIRCVDNQLFSGVSTESVNRKCQQIMRLTKISNLFPAPRSPVPVWGRRRRLLICAGKVPD